VIVIIVMVVGNNNRWVVEDVSSVGEPCVNAREDVSACTNHVWGESELLAVELEEVSVFFESVLASLASFVQSLDSPFLVGDFFVVCGNALVVSLNALIIVTNSIVVFGDVVFEVVNLVVKIDEDFSDGLKSDHKLSFGSKSTFVVTLCQVLFPWVVVINLSPEVSGWNITMIRFWVVRWIMHWLWVMVGVMGFFRFFRIVVIHSGVV